MSGEVMLSCKCGLLNASTEEFCKNCGRRLKPKKQIVEECVKKTTTQVGFYVDTQTISLEDIRKLYVIDVTFEIEANPKYANWTLTKLANGKVFLFDGSMVQEIEANDVDFSGLIITKSKPKRLTQTEALELIKSGIPFFDSPQLERQCVFYKKQ